MIIEFLVVIHCPVFYLKQDGNNVQTVDIYICCHGLTYWSLGQLSVPGWTRKNTSNVKYFTGPVNDFQDLWDDTRTPQRRQKNSETCGWFIRS
jgi:hypothetical protein